MILGLSFCSCVAKEVPQETVQPAGKWTAEEAIETNTPLYSRNLSKEIVDDLEAAKETYEGRYYLINFIVDSITNESYIRGMGECPSDTVKHSVYYTAFLPAEEREGIAPGDIIQVVGKLSAIEKHFNGATFVEFTDAHCTAKTFQVSGEVLMINHNGADEVFCSLGDSGLLSPKGEEIAIFLPEGFNLAVGDTITCTGKVHGSIGMVFLSPSSSAELLWMEIPESLEATVGP